MTNATAGVQQTNQYYPFGMMFAESTNPKVQDYKYNGKELDQMHGLNHYDYSARQYDPARLQFTTVDPLSEKFYSWSPYAYVMNNPIRLIDIDGKAPGDVVVTFGGADIKRNGEKGLATTIINTVISQELNINGGSAQAFASDYWGSSIYSKGGLDKATQEAYNFIRNNYNVHNGERVIGGKVIIEGYSYGGVLANYLSKRLSNDNISTDLLILVDAASGPTSSDVSRKVSTSVKEVDNYYQTSSLSLVGSRGEQVEGKGQTVINNIKVDANHATIDDKTINNVIDRIFEFLRK